MRKRLISYLSVLLRSGENNLKIMKTKTCSVSGKEFVITDEDLAFYEKIGVGEPTLCPDERQKRRFSYRNERNFYSRVCDATGKSLISVYSSDKNFPVYDQQYWWSDDWDPLSYGKEFDFDRPFFDQFYDLNLQVPRPSILNAKSENCLYTNHSEQNKDCYMCMNTGFCEDCYYCSNYNLDNKNCVDCFCIQDCELGYFFMDCKQCSYSSFLWRCERCVDSMFCFDCRSCQDCFGCWNLRHKQYCFFNKQLTKAEYEAAVKNIRPVSWGDYMQLFDQLCEKVQADGFHRSALIEKSENCSGDNIFRSKNIEESYFALDSEDCRHCYDFGKTKCCQDSTEMFEGEWQYECHACNFGNFLIGCSKCYHNNDLFYSQYCYNSSDLFGCFGLRKKQYCIFNKQYEREEYERLRDRIVEHMKKTGEWGEFFPKKYSSFCYNETTAHEYYPLTEVQVEAFGGSWKDESAHSHYQGPEYEIPRKIEDVDDDILKSVLVCEVSGKHYRLIKSELEFYRKMNLPIPRMSPDERHRKRMKLRSPRQLFLRTCGDCGCDIQTTYGPGRKEKVLCEKCYNKIIN